MNLVIRFDCLYVCCKIIAAQCYKPIMRRNDDIQRMLLDWTCWPVSVGQGGHMTHGKLRMSRMYAIHGPWVAMEDSSVRADDRMTDEHFNIISTLFIFHYFPYFLPGHSASHVVEWVISLVMYLLVCSTIWSCAGDGVCSSMLLRSSELRMFSDAANLGLGSSAQY